MRLDIANLQASVEQISGNFIKMTQHVSKINEKVEALAAPQPTSSVDGQDATSTSVSSQPLTNAETMSKCVTESVKQVMSDTMNDRQENA